MMSVGHSSKILASKPMDSISSTSCSAVALPSMKCTCARARSKFTSTFLGDAENFGGTRMIFFYDITMNNVRADPAGNSLFIPNYPQIYALFKFNFMPKPVILKRPVPRHSSASALFPQPHYKLHMSFLLHSAPPILQSHWLCQSPTASRPPCGVVSNDAVSNAARVAALPKAHHLGPKQPTGRLIVFWMFLVPWWRGSKLPTSDDIILCIYIYIYKIIQINESTFTIKLRVYFKKHQETIVQYVCHPTFQKLILWPYRASSPEKQAQAIPAGQWYEFLLRRKVSLIG